MITWITLIALELEMVESWNFDDWYRSSLATRCQQHRLIRFPQQSRKVKIHPKINFLKLDLTIPKISRCLPRMQCRNLAFHSGDFDKILRSNQKFYENTQFRRIARPLKNLYLWLADFRQKVILADFELNNRPRAIVLFLFPKSHFWPISNKIALKEPVFVPKKLF